MNRTELEIKLNNDRVWLLETFTTMSDEDLTCGITTSRHNPESRWSAKDHLAHLIGIETVFNTIIRRYLDGNANPVGVMVNEDGTPRSREAIMADVHAMNEKWVSDHRDKNLDELIALGQKVRGETLALVSGLTNEQLSEKIPGAPWGDGAIATIIGINGDHARQHYGWVREGLAGHKA
ncbi:MAG: DinB family protein [Acidobacteriota bacterium]